MPGTPMRVGPANRPVPGPGLRVPVLSSKIEPLRPPRRAVVRDRLDAVLDGDHQIVAVIAPAGYGKSSLLASWVSRRPSVNVAWVSLDVLDASPLTFWRDVIGALERVVPDLGEARAVLLERGAHHETVATLAHALLESGEQITLVLDDVHAANPAEVRESLTLLADRCRDVLRLVVAGRRDPPLPLGRWLVEERLAELRLADLAFAPSEAEQLLEGYDVLGLGADELGRLTERTEGWPVGLLLSAIALDGQPDLPGAFRHVLETERHITDYVVGEVVDRLRPDVAALAMDLAVLPFFDGALAEALTGSPDARATLDELVRENPFVVSSVSDAGLRYHHLIRAFFKGELERRSPARAEQLRRRAATLMLEREHVDAAVALFVESGDLATAFDVVVRPSLQHLDAGRRLEFARWFDTLPPLRPDTAEQALDYSMALLNAGRVTEAVRWADRAWRLEASGEEGVESIEVLRAATSLVALGTAGDCEAAAAYVPLLESFGHDVEGSSRIDGRMSAQLVRLALQRGDLPAAARWLEVLRRHGNPVLHRAHAAAMQAWLLFEQGDVRRSLDDALRAVGACSTLGLGPHNVTIDARLALARALLERLETRRAADVLDEVTEEIELVEVPFFHLRLWPLRFRQRSLEHGWPAALAFVESMPDGDALAASPDLVDLRARMHARALLGCGRVDRARPVVDALRPSNASVVLRARLELMCGHADLARASLAGSESWPWTERLVAHLVAAQAQPEEASAQARAALQLGERVGSLAPFVLEGRSVARLLDTLPLGELHPDLATWRTARDVDATSSRSVAHVIEPLTDKELDVLVHLPSHLTYRGIAALLYVSVNTVKTHVSAIYRKLGVSSRGEAVRVATTAGLVKEDDDTRA